MFGLSSLATTLLGAAAIAVVAAGTSGYFVHNYDTGQAAKLALAQSQAAETQTRRQAGIAMAEAKAGQDAVNKIAAAIQPQQAQIVTRTVTLTKEVVKYVPQVVDSGVGINWGFVRLFDAAASGSADPSALPIAPGQSDSATSDVKLSEIAAVSVANDGACYANAKQLAAFREWAGAVAVWYADLTTKLQSASK